MKFIVSKEFFDKVPNAVFGVIIAKGIDNTKKHEEIEEMLHQETQNIYDKYHEVKVKELPEIELYREAARNININPNKYMCSIEAMISRTAKSNFVPNINSLVDLGNALSLRHVIPLGIHDLDKISGDIELRPATEDDRFIPFGSTEYDNPDVGEIIYVSNNEVRTRRWTWRQGENGKIDETAKNVFIPMDGFIENKESVLRLQKEFKEELNKYGVETICGIVDKDNNVFEF